MSQELISLTISTQYLSCASCQDVHLECLTKKHVMHASPLSQLGLIPCLPKTSLVNSLDPIDVKKLFPSHIPSHAFYFCISAWDLIFCNTFFVALCLFNSIFRYFMAISTNVWKTFSPTSAHTNRIFASVDSYQANTNINIAPLFYHTIAIKMPVCTITFTLKVLLFQKNLLIHQ